MSRTWITVDVSALTHRAGYSISTQMKHNGKSTNVVFGFLKAIKELEVQFGSRYFAFAFDSRKSLRREKFSYYKARLNTFNPGDANIRKEIHLQTDQLRHEILPALGYKNVFIQEGYEADDIIASVVKGIGGRESVVMVSSDGDLYQLLDESVTQFRPHNKTMMTDALFRHTFRLKPRQWAVCKAIAGCKSDTIPGVMGVAEIWASLYLSGRMQPDHQRYKAIMEWQQSQQFKDNLELIELPFNGTAIHKPITHPAITEDAWEKVYEKLGIASLDDPYGAAKVRRGMVKR